MTQESIDANIKEHGYAEAVMNDIRRGIKFNYGMGLSLEALVNRLKEAHSIEEIDSHDAVWGLCHIHTLMAVLPAARQNIQDVGALGLINIQIRLADSFMDVAKTMSSHSLRPETNTFMALMK